MLKKIVPIIFLSILSAAGGLLLDRLSTIQNLNDLFGDVLIRYFAPVTNVSDKIVLVLLDEETMKGLPYRSPVPRDFLYELNEKLLAAKPTAVAYDIFFKDPTVKAYDQRLANSLKKGPTFAVSAGKTDSNKKDFEDLPMDIFRNSLKGVGLSDLPFSSSDATVRYAQFEFDFTKNPSIVAELYNAVGGGRAEALLHDPKNQLHIAGFSFPPFVDGKGVGGEKTRIRFAENSLFKMFPARLVASGLVPQAWLKDKVVLVGAAYDDGTDAYLTPYYSARYNFRRMPGVEIHANILNQLLTRQFYYSMPNYMIPLKLASIGLLAAILFMFGGLLRGAISFAALFALIPAGTIFWFNRVGLIPPVATFECALIITFTVSLGIRFMTEGRQKRFIKDVFAKYVPPAVVDKMIGNPKLLTLGGEQREVTCLFTDIASFTTISERLDPKTLVKFLNEYLDRLTKIVFKFGGTLDKYEGDAIICFFGAPIDVSDHRGAALRASAEMQKATSEISAKWESELGRPVVTRIGISSGPVVVGNMGSSLRFDYTAIGDTMNTASRLEGANKFFNTRTLASASVVEPTMSNVKDILLRPLARIKVKGKTEAIKIYEIGVDKFYGGPEEKDVIELTSK
jgi:adenylate cyclase